MKKHVLLSVGWQGPSGEAPGHAVARDGNELLPQFHLAEVGMGDETSKTTSNVKMPPKRPKPIRTETRQTITLLSDATTTLQTIRGTLRTLL